MVDRCYQLLFWFPYTCIVPHNENMSAIQIKPLLGCLVGGPRERVVEDQMKRRWRPKKKRWHLSTYHVCRHLLLVCQRISSSGLGVLWWLNSFDRILAEVCWRGERLFQVWWNIIFVFGDTCHIFLHTDSKEWNNRDHVQTSGRLAASLCETVPQLLRLQHLQRILESLGSTPFGSQVLDLIYLCSRIQTLYLLVPSQAGDIKRGQPVRAGGEQSEVGALWLVGAVHRRAGGRPLRLQQPHRVRHSPCRVRACLQTWRWHFVTKHCVFISFPLAETCYNCRDCGQDATCVLCVQCFTKSEHKQHRYLYFFVATILHIIFSKPMSWTRYRMSTSDGGGYCDCGDAEAWRFSPCCELHKPTSSGEGRSADEVFCKL